MNLQIKSFHIKLLSLFLLPFFQKFLILTPLLLRKKINVRYDNKRIKIQIILILLVLYLFLYDIIFSQLSFHTIKSISPFAFILFSSFLSINFDFLFKIRRCIYIIFFLDFFANVSSILLSVNIYGGSVSYFSSAYHSLVGIYGHPYLSLTLSAVTFFYASIFKERRMIFLSIFGLVIASSLRSLLILFPIIVSYYILSKRFGFLTAPILLIAGMFLIFHFVKLDSNEAESSRCKLNIMTNTYYDCGVLNSSALRYYAWKAFAAELPNIYKYGSGLHEGRDNYTNLDFELIDKFKIFESPYFQYINDYGVPFFILLISLFLFWMFDSYHCYIKSNRNPFKTRLYASKFAISSLFFFDSFYGTFFFCIISYTTLQFVLFFE